MTDEHLTDSKITCNLRLGLLTGGPALSYFSHLGFRKFGLRVVFSSELRAWAARSSPWIRGWLAPTFRMAIVCIIAASAEREVVWVKAWRVIAGMHENFVARNSSVDDFECQPVNPPIFSIVANDSVSSVSSVSDLKWPRQAGIGIFMGKKHLRYQLRLAKFSMVGFGAMVLDFYEHISIVCSRWADRNGYLYGGL